MSKNLESVPIEIVAILESQDYDPEIHGTIEDWLAWEGLMKDSDSVVVGNNLMDKAIISGIDAADLIDEADNRG